MHRSLDLAGSGHYNFKKIKYLVEKNLDAEKSMVEENSGKIILYGTTWCGSTRRARTLLDEEKIEYTWVDIEKDEEAARYVESVANGYRSVPTLALPDGTILVEPSMFELKLKLGL